MAGRTGLNADFGPMADTLGNISGITGYIKTDRHISKAVRTLANATAEDIGTLMDDETQAIGYPYAPLAHAYEYEAFRDDVMKPYRLFRFNVNTGSSRTATLSYMFTMSKFEIATPRENVEAGLISLREKSLDAFEKEDKRYVFKTQAISYEYGAETTVKSRKGMDGWLAIPQKFNPRPQFVKGSYLNDLSQAQGGVHFGAFNQRWIELGKTITTQKTERFGKAIERLVIKNTKSTSRATRKSFSVAFNMAEKKGLDHMRRDLERMYDLEESGEY